MSAISVTFKASGAIQPSGDLLYVNFEDGSQLELSGPEGLQQWVLARLPDLDGVRALAIANRLAQDPLMDSPAVWDGKTITLDPEQALPADVFKVT
jgi:hypothetical protein